MPQPSMCFVGTWRLSLTLGPPFAFDFRAYLPSLSTLAFCRCSMLSFSFGGAIGSVLPGLCRSFPPMAPFPTLSRHLKIPSRVLTAQFRHGWLRGPKVGRGMKAPDYFLRWVSLMHPRRNCLMCISCATDPFSCTSCRTPYLFSLVYKTLPCPLCSFLPSFVPTKRSVLPFSSPSVISLSRE